jgi:hypothetical protein
MVARLATDCHERTRYGVISVGYANQVSNQMTPWRAGERVGNEPTTPP